jgi:predicted HTH transcriptional regulator
MFEIKCIIGDKKLVAVLTLLDGHTLEPPVVTPVNRAQTPKLNGHAPWPTNGTKAWTTVPGGSVNLMRSFVKGHKKLTARQMREHLEANGYSKNGYSYSLQALLKEGVLKKTKEPRVYEVVR